MALRPPIISDSHFAKILTQDVAYILSPATFHSEKITETIANNIRIDIPEIINIIEQFRGNKYLLLTKQCEILIFSGTLITTETDPNNISTLVNPFDHKTLHKFVKKASVTLTRSEFQVQFYELRVSFQYHAQEKFNLNQLRNSQEEGLPRLSNKVLNAISRCNSPRAPLLSETEPWFLNGIQPSILSFETYYGIQNYSFSTGVQEQYASAAAQIRKIDRLRAPTLFQALTRRSKFADTIQHPQDRIYYQARFEELRFKYAG